ncbi:MAG: IucA/IucC family protein, partial [Bacteroidota bacterium]
MKKLVIQHSILRLIYAAFHEQIFKVGEHYFLLKFEHGKEVFFQNEYDVLALIYTKPTFDAFELFLSDDERNRYQAIESLSFFWEELLMPNLGIEPSFISDERFKASLEDIKLSILGEAIALKEKEKLYTEITAQSRENMWEMLLHQNSFERALFLMRFASLRGNPTHPLTKLKKGFRISEIKAYSPENAQTVEIVIIAVAQGICKCTKMYQSIFVHSFFSQHYPQAYEKWRLKL